MKKLLGILNVSYDWDCNMWIENYDKWLGSTKMIYLFESSEYPQYIMYGLSFLNVY